MHKILIYKAAFFVGMLHSIACTNPKIKGRQSEAAPHSPQVAPPKNDDKTDPKVSVTIESSNDIPVPSQQPLVNGSDEKEKQEKRKSDIYRFNLLSEYLKANAITVPMMKYNVPLTDETLRNFLDETKKQLNNNADDFLYISKNIDRPDLEKGIKLACETGKKIAQSIRLKAQYAAEKSYAETAKELNFLAEDVAKNVENVCKLYIK